MRIRSHIRRVTAERSDSTRGTGRRGTALGALVALAMSIATVAALTSDPRLPSTWAYRAIIRARGGTFVSYPGAVLQSGFTDCGPAALATLLHTLGGTSPPVDSIAVLAGTGARGTRLEGLARAARVFGVVGELRRLTPATQAALNTPVLAWVDEGHFVTVVPVAPDSAWVLDPQVGPYRMSMRRLGRYWAGEALVPGPQHNSVAAGSNVSTVGGIE